MTRRRPHPLVTLAGWIVIGYAIAYVLTAFGWAFEHVLDAVFGGAR